MPKKDADKPFFESAKKAKKAALKALAEKEGAELDTLREEIANKIKNAVDGGKLQLAINVQSIFAKKLKVELDELEYTCNLISRGEITTLKIDWSNEFDGSKE